MNQLFLLRSFLYVFYCLFLTLLSKSANKLGENNIKHSLCIVLLMNTIGKMCSYIPANGGGFVYEESEERLMVNLNIFITSL